MALAVGSCTGALRAVEGLLGLVHRLGHDDDAVEARCAQSPHQARPVAHHHDIATQFPSTADAANERPQAGGVHEGDGAHVDDKPWHGGQLGESLAELAYGECIELAYGTTNCVAVGRLFLLDIEHSTPSKGLLPQSALTAWYEPNVTKMLPAAVARYPHEVPELLIATDSPQVFEEVRSIVEEPGAGLRWAREGRHVVPSLQERAADLVIADLQIGSMGGYAIAMDVMLEVGAERLAPTPVLLLLDRRPDVFLARRTGVAGWMMKPLDPIRLRRAVGSMLAGGTYYDESFLPEPSNVRATGGPLTLERAEL